MQVADVHQVLRGLAAERGYSEHAPPTALSLIDLVIGWYATSRVDGVDMDAHGDMLLFQWGTYDWGEGPTFQVDITRQLISRPLFAATDDDDDSEIWQLSSRLHYPSGPEPAAIGAGNRWCSSPSDADVDEFRAFIDATDAMAFARRHRASRFELRFEGVD